MSSVSNFRIFHGSANPQLAKDIAKLLNIPVGKALLSRFSDGEVRFEIAENIRGRDIFVIQSTCCPTNDTVMELVLMGDALRRASANSITAIIPYYGYGRQDRRVRSERVPISAKVVADMIQGVGFTRMITVDLHADQIQGFFTIPVDNLYASTTMMEQHDIKENDPHPLIVSPDVGGVVRARAIAKRLHNKTDLAIIDKRRPGPNKSEVMNVIGDVKGRHCVIVDDIVDTAGTLCRAAEALKDNGALSVSAYCVHAVLSGEAVQNITNSAIDKLIVSDTIPLSETAKKCSKIKQITLSRLLAETISRINLKESLSSMFNDE